MALEMTLDKTGAVEAVWSGVVDEVAAVAAALTAALSSVGSLRNLGRISTGTPCFANEASLAILDHNCIR
jgi:hypothetical protein